MRKREEPVRPALPAPGLTPLELAQDLLSRIDQGGAYAKLRKEQFRRRSATTRVVSLALSVASTIILGLQQLNFWTGLAFALVAIVTVVNTLEPFFAWRSRWVLMEEAQHEFYRLRDELTYSVAATPPDQLDPATMRTMFDQYQKIWDDLSSRWLEYRRSGSPGQ